METNAKLMMLLRLMDEPKAMTEAQLQDLLADEEVREMYELMADCKKVYRRVENERVKSAKYKLLFIRKIAAVFIVVAFLGGLAFAAYHFLSPNTEKQSAEVSAPFLTGSEGRESAIRFSNARLDSILTVVSVFYGKTVCFRDSTTCELRMSTIWDCEDSLAVFIAMLNEFDGLRLKDEGDTLFVESETEEADR